LSASGAVRAAPPGMHASFRKPIKGVKRKLERHCDGCFILTSRIRMLAVRQS
jgi:hypothetical protein